MKNCYANTRAFPQQSYRRRCFCKKGGKNFINVSSFSHCSQIVFIKQKTLSVDASEHYLTKNDGEKIIYECGKSENMVKLFMILVLRSFFFFYFHLEHTASLELFHVLFISLCTAQRKRKGRKVASIAHKSRSKRSKEPINQVRERKSSANNKLFACFIAKLYCNYIKKLSRYFWICAGRACYWMLFRVIQYLGDKRALYWILFVSSFTAEIYTHGENFIFHLSSAKRMFALPRHLFQCCSSHIPPKAYCHIRNMTPMISVPLMISHFHINNWTACCDNNFMKSSPFSMKGWHFANDTRRRDVDPKDDSKNKNLIYQHQPYQHHHLSFCFAYVMFIMSVSRKE